VEVKGFGWLGIRTAHFEQTVTLFRDVMNLEVIREEHDVVGLRFPDDTEMEVWRPSDDFHSFFTTGPVVGFRVDDAKQARARMETAGIEFIGSVLWACPTGQPSERRRETVTNSRENGPRSRPTHPL